MIVIVVLGDGGNNGDGGDNSGVDVEMMMVMI